MINKNKLRKSIARSSYIVSHSTGEDRWAYIKDVQWKQSLLKNADFIADFVEELPSLGKLRLVLEAELRRERIDLDGKVVPSDNDFKRHALMSAVYDYYMELPYPPDTTAVDFDGDLTARRDDQDVDGTDVDLAPNKNDIYGRWMDKLGKLIRENKLSDVEFDEARDRGIPQGGAFEKQLDRYRKDFMKELWNDFNKYYKH